MFLSEIKLNIVDEFLNSLSTNELRMYSIRDNCGPATIHFISFAKDHNITLNRVHGEFKLDTWLHDKRDFTPKMKQEFLSSGLNWNSDNDRLMWIKTSKLYSQDWKWCPHYWAEDASGKIYDPAGELQFIKTKLAKNLSKNRYKKM
jgi:hypothetical protein